MFNKYFKAYQSQKSGATARGIEWKLTFREWRDWWGDDIDKRGRGANQLQMQRFNDSGPYAIGNITKGTPKQNAATAAAQFKIKHQALVDSGYVWEPQKGPRLSDAIGHVDMHGNPIEPDDAAEDSWIEPQVYGRAKPLCQLI